MLKNSKRILVVDDDPIQCRINREMLQKFGYHVDIVNNGEEAISQLKQQKNLKFDLVILDLVMPVLNGMQVLEEIKKRNINIPIIVQTAYGTLDRAIAAMKAGASDFIVKPVKAGKLIDTIEAIKLNKTTKINIQSKKNHFEEKQNFRFHDIDTKSKKMQLFIERIQRVAKSNISIFIVGESGVGKELMARSVRNCSVRADKPFVIINCGTIPENLAESILFGHEKGAFTGASNKHSGKLFEADGGTVFFDEVCELPLDTQVKLLRALQEGEIEPVGSNKYIKIDIRVIAATNRDPIAMIKQKKFREDLYYRLGAFTVRMPSLRERAEDIVGLAEKFTKEAALDENRHVTGITKEAQQLLKQYKWPGNIRELKNIISTAVVLTDHQKLQVEDFNHIAKPYCQAS